MATRRDVDHQARASTLVGVSGPEFGGQFLGLVYLDAPVVELDGRPGTDPDHQQVARDGHQCVGPGGDLRQQDLRVVAEEPEGGGEGALHQRPHPVELGTEPLADGVGRPRPEAGGRFVGSGGGSRSVGSGPVPVRVVVPAHGRTGSGAHPGRCTRPR